MAVAVLNDWVGQTAGAPTGSLTISAGSNRMLLVVYFQEDGTKTFTSITVGGQAPTGSLLETAVNTVDGQKIWSWYWDETAIAAMSGTTCTLTTGGSVAKHDWDYITFSGVTDGAEYATTVDVASSNDTSITTTSASSADDFIVVMLSRSAAARDVTAYDNLTQGWQFNTDYSIAVADGAGGDDTVSLTGDGFAGDWFVQLLHLKSAAGNPMMMRMMFEGHMNG